MILLHGTAALVYIGLIVLGCLIKFGAHVGRWLSGQPKPNPYGTVRLPAQSTPAPAAAAPDVTAATTEKASD